MSYDPQIDDIKPNPCPFCDSEDLEMSGERPRNLPPSGNYYIYCTGCGVYGPSGKDSSDAIEQWNRPGNEIDEVEQELKTVEYHLKMLGEDADRLRRELDDCNGVIR